MANATYQFSHPEVFREIERMGITGKYSPSYVGRVRRGYDHSDELSALIAKAESRLKAKAKTKPRSASGNL